MAGVSEVSPLVLHRLATSDRPEFVARLQASFAAGAGSFGDESTEPVISEVEIYESMDQLGAISWEVRERGNRVGGIVVAFEDDGRRASLDLLFIDTGAQGMGIGARVWSAIEALYPEVEVWKTLTPYEDTRNIHFYVNKCGFQIVEFFHPGRPDPNGPVFAVGAEGNSNPDLMFAFEKRRSPLGQHARSGMFVDESPDGGVVVLRGNV